MHFLQDYPKNEAGQFLISESDSANTMFLLDVLRHALLEEGLSKDEVKVALAEVCHDEQQDIFALILTSQIRHRIALKDQRVA